MMKPLNFNSDEQLIDELVYISAVSQHEDHGLTWEEIRVLFPESAESMKKRYMEENWE